MKGVQSILRLFSPRPFGLLVDTFKFPLIFNTRGIAVHEEGSREYYSQLLSNLAVIEFGELPLRPDVGVPDITFSSTGSFIPIVSAAAQHIPEILITNVSQTPTLSGETLGTTTLSVDFEVINAVS